MKKVINKIFIYIFMLIIIFISVIPFVYMVMMSFKSTTNAYDFDFSLEKLTLMQYQKIFSLANFPNYVFNSVFVAVVGVILTVTVCSLAGYAFAKMDFKGTDKLFIFLIMTMVVPSEVILIPLFLIIKNLGWLNTFKALILPLPTAFGVFIMRQAVLDIPDDLINVSSDTFWSPQTTHYNLQLFQEKSTIASQRHDHASFPAFYQLNAWLLIAANITSASITFLSI